MLRTVAYAVALSFLLAPFHARQAFSQDKPADASQPVKKTWAHILMKGDYPEGAQLPPLFGEASENLATGIERLDKAAKDDAVAGVVLRIDSPTLGWAKLNELKQAIGRVRSAGKQVYAYADSASSTDYLLATGCDKIVMPESAVLMLLGMRAEVTFYKNLFDKLDVRADMLRVGEFKSAAEPYTRTEMSPEFRTEMDAILDDYFKQLVDAIAEARKLPREKVVAAIDSGPHTAAAAKEMGLIDAVAYEDELPALIKGDDAKIEIALEKKYGKKKSDTDLSGLAGMMKMMSILMGTQEPAKKSTKPKIAIIHATGMINTGRSQSDLLGTSVLGSDTLVKAVQDAGGDSKVKAIVLRVDSPGGSALASDLIWRALEKVDKPVVVSMGDVAASGGYYISMGADAIFAEPGTLTGSIGVVGGKFAIEGLFEKVGVTTTTLSRGANSGVMSMLEGFSDSEREAMTRLLHEVYDQFTKKAAQGRRMDHEQLEKLARGRVYTGTMALEVGLVDKLGTLEDAVAHARELAQIGPDEDIERQILPKAVSPLESLFGPADPDASMRSNSGPAQGLMEAIHNVSPEFTDKLRHAAVINILAREPRLTLMPFQLRVK
jgi:protease-4